MLAVAAKLCSVCYGAMTESSATGRPAAFCTRVCRDELVPGLGRAPDYLSEPTASRAHVGERAFGGPEYLRGQVGPS